MKTFLKIILLSPLTLHTLWAGGSSYSSYGYGLVEFTPNVRSGGMGKTGIAVPSMYAVNVYNPAALMGITMVRADASAFYEQLQVKDRSATANSNTATFGHLAFAIPFGKKMAAAITLSRFSRIGYEYSLESADDLGEIRTERFEGSGGTQLLGFTFAGRPHSNWSAGFSVQYALGSTERIWQVDWNSPEVADTDNNYTNNLSGLRWVVGTLYSQERYRIGAFAGFANEMNNEVIQTRGTEDTVLSATQKADFPVEWGLGATYGLSPRYTLAFDFVHTLWNSVRLNGADPGFRNTIRFGLGAERSPKADLSSHYLETLAYRAGFYSQNLYTRNTSGKYSSEYFVTAGVGIPFFRGRNMIDVSLELGRRGNLSTSNVRDTVFRLNVSISGGEYWFQNRKKRSQGN